MPSIPSKQTPAEIVRELKEKFDTEVAKLTKPQQLAFAQIGLGLSGTVRPLLPDHQAMRSALGVFFNGASTAIAVLMQAKATGTELTVEDVQVAVMTHAKLNGFKFETVMETNEDKNVGKN